MFTHIHGTYHLELGWRRTLHLKVEVNATFKAIHDVPWFSFTFSFSACIFFYIYISISLTLSPYALQRTMSINEQIQSPETRLRTHCNLMALNNGSRTVFITHNDLPSWMWEKACKIMCNGHHMPDRRQRSRSLHLIWHFKLRCSQDGLQSRWRIVFE